MSAPGRALDPSRLPDWLACHLSGCTGVLRIERLHGGQSNPIWRVANGARAWIVRSKPGPVADLLPSAHAIEREYRVLQALQCSAVPVPGVHLLCEDEAILGAAFYVMDCVEGRILRDLTDAALSPAERGALQAEALKVLAALHRIDWRERGLADFGRHEGHVERLIARWTRQYRATETAPIEAMEHLIAWLPAHLPDFARRPETTLVHGDFRLENLVFHPRRAEVRAVLDWELSSLGHPLLDLAYHCTGWHLPGGLLRGLAGQDLAALGLPTEHETVLQYAQLVGRTDGAEILAHWPYFVACNLFRIAAILQGVAWRAQQGAAAHPQAQAIGAMAGPVAEIGWRLALRDPSHQHPDQGQD